MSKRSFPILVWLVYATVGYISAQNAHTYRQPAHTFLKEVTWRDSIYLYPEFRPGSITYFTGFAPERALRLNYNLYYAQIDMIGENGDTVQISPSKTFRSVTIGSDVFLYEPKEGYVRIMIKGDVALAERTYFFLKDMKFVSGSTPNYSPLDYDVRGRTSNFDRYFVKASTWFFVNRAGTIYPASRTVLKKFFPEYKNAIQDFTRKHDTNFLNESDLIEITQYCNSLRRIPSPGAGGMMVRANERVSQALRDSIYRFSGFQEGIVVYQDGRQSQYTSLNYNLMAGEMQAIENGDTVGINTNRFVTNVNIDGTTYLRKSEGYIEVLLNGRAMLGVVRTLAMSHSQAIAASSRYAPVEAYDPTTAYLDRVNFDRLFSRKNEYYLIDERGTVFTPTAGTLRRLFPYAKTQLDDYMRLHQPDLQNEEDLKGVVSYLTGLGSR
ncbi:MAG: hypothetical protein QM762_25440 [Chryseolinea sp.]